MNPRCASISQTPHYVINSISNVTIPTYYVGQATAIANIKNILNTDKGVYFSFTLPSFTAWDNFYNFWECSGGETEASLWNDISSFCSETFDWGIDGGHGVVIYGYNDDDPDPANHYWMVLNSWGTAGGKRPHGVYRIPMYFDYDCIYHVPLEFGGVRAFSFETLDIEFAGGNGCTTNADCDDGVFCNGEETCLSGECVDGTDPCEADETCDENADVCDASAECEINADCDDGVFCNGDEICTGGVCVPGTDPCPGEECDETTDQCGESEGDWYQWDDDIPYSSAGWIGGGIWTSAVYFNPSDLPGNGKIIKIRVAVGDLPSNAVMKIWQGRDLNSMELQYSQTFIPMAYEYIEVVLDRPYVINDTQDLMFGWSATHIEGEYPSFIDEFTNPNQKGNLYLNQVTRDWGHVPFEGDWAIAAFIEGCDEERDLDLDGDVDKDDAKLLKQRQKEEKTDLKVKQKDEKVAMKAAIGFPEDCGMGWDLNDDCYVDKDDAKLLKLRQKEEKTDLKVTQKSEKSAMKAALQ